MFCECYEGRLGRGSSTWLIGFLVCGTGVRVLHFLGTPWVHVSSTFTWAGGAGRSHWGFPPSLSRTPTKASPSPHLCLARCCSQSPRANLVPVLTLSVSSVVAGVVRSSVDTGKARGRAPPFSSISTALHNDSCLGRASGLSPTQASRVGWGGVRVNFT